MKKQSRSHRMNSVIKTLVLTAIFFMLNSTDSYTQNSRKVVFEIFSEVWCGPCASVSPMHKVWLENHPDYIPIYYYSHFYDNNVKVMNSTADYNARNSFYSVPFYPFGVINAVKAPNDSYPGFPTDTNRMNAIIDTMSKTTPVKIDVNFSNKGTSGNVKVSVTSDIELNSKHLYVIIVEKSHTYQKQSNGMTDFHHIMRRILPSQGQLFSIKAGETLDFEFDYELPSYINMDLFATVIVQDMQSKYIYQAESVFEPFNEATVPSIDFGNDILSIFPNPVKDNFTISLRTDSENLLAVELLDLMGNIVKIKDSEINSNNLNISLHNQFGRPVLPGIYFLKVSTQKNVYVQKIIVY